MYEKIKPIYPGKPEEFLWAAFGSGSGTNTRECAKIIKPGMVFSDRPGAGMLALEELAGIPKIVINGYKACGSWQKSIGNPKLEAEYQKKSLEYNQQILNKLKKFEDKRGKGIDLIVLGGYMRIVGEPLLEAYHDKIINVHPADLSILKNNKRAYTGSDAVYDAIKAGEKETRSSVILVNKDADQGEILTQGLALKVWPEYLGGTDSEKDECLRKYAAAHQSMQKVRSDWPALTLALRMIAEGRLALGTKKSLDDELRQVYCIC